MKRRYIGTDVLSAARQRIANAFDQASRVYVSFSGGKDSTVMLHLVAEEARQRKRKFGLLFVDLEGQYHHTIEHVEACFDQYADITDPFWVALPLNLRNAVSQYEPHWCCWESGREKDWIRKPPKRAIVKDTFFPFFKHRMEFEEFVPKFADWYAGDEDAVCFVGIRTQESLNRWRTITSDSKTRVNVWCWSTRKSLHSWNAYPIYDWKTEDIWTYHARYPDQPSNEVYNLMHRAGLTIHQQRICQPYGDDQRKGLWLFHVLEPQTWAKVVARVNGANQGALYAQERGSILGVNKISKPDGHTWKSFARLLLESMPKATADHYEIKIGVFQQWWEARGYTELPDELDAKLEAKKEGPSWRRIVKALLRNDYWCKGLSFSQQKDATSYARYHAIMRAKSFGRNLWELECGVDQPDRPTAKQLAMIAAFTGGCTPHQAWQGLAKHLNVSVRVAQRDASRKDASDAIAALKQAESDFRAERFVLTAKKARGVRIEGLPGEGRRRRNNGHR